MQEMKEENENKRKYNNIDSIRLRCHATTAEGYETEWKLVKNHREQLLQTYEYEFASVYRRNVQGQSDQTRSDSEYARTHTNTHAYYIHFIW